MKLIDITTSTFIAGREGIKTALDARFLSHILREGTILVYAPTTTRSVVLFEVSEDTPVASSLVPVLAGSPLPLGDLHVKNFTHASIGMCRFPSHKELQMYKDAKTV